MRRCLGHGQLYFTAEDNQKQCYGKRYLLKEFWLESPQGRDAIICARHVRIFLDKHSVSMLGKSHLYRQMVKAGVFTQ